MVTLAGKKLLYVAPDVETGRGYFSAFSADVTALSHGGDDQFPSLLDVTVDHLAERIGPQDIVVFQPPSSLPLNDGSLISEHISHSRSLMQVVHLAAAQAGDPSVFAYLSTTGGYSLNPISTAGLLGTARSINIDYGSEGKRAFRFSGNGTRTSWNTLCVLLSDSCNYVVEDVVCGNRHPEAIDVAYVVGGASGIGKEIAQYVSTKRSIPVVILDKNKDLAATVARGIEAAGGSAEAHFLDVSDYESVHATFDTVWRNEHCLLVNTAGIGRVGKAGTLSEEDALATAAVNVAGTYHIFYEMQRLQAEGVLFTVGSTVGGSGMPDRFGYVVDKHEVRAIGEYFSNFNMRVLTGEPGRVHTPFVHSHVIPGMRKEYPDLSDEQLLKILHQTAGVRQHMLDPAQLAENIVTLSLSTGVEGPVNLSGFHGHSMAEHNVLFGLQLHQNASK